MEDFALINVMSDGEDGRFSRDAVSSRLSQAQARHALNALTDRSARLATTDTSAHVHHKQAREVERGTTTAALFRG